MFRKIIDYIFGIDLPLWAHGLECGVCCMTFVNAEAHYNHVNKNRLIEEHFGKIPIIKSNGRKK